MPIVFLSLGTNLGDRLHALDMALHTMPSAAELTILAKSRVYETPPWGYEDQPAFLNMVVKAESVQAPQVLLTHLKMVETDLGRLPSFHWGPRAIDIDILFYDNVILDTPTLVIPHPRIQERAFVLVPLGEIAPNLLHPVLGETVSQLRSRLDTSRIKLFASAP